MLTAATGTDDASPLFSPDGKSIVFHSFDTDRAFNDQGHLSLLARTKGRIRALAPQFDRATMHVQWRPDPARSCS